MSYYSPSIEKLVEAFEKLPSIGHKTAVRLAFYILESPKPVAEEMANALIDAKDKIKLCSGKNKYTKKCRRYNGNICNLHRWT